MIVPRTPVVAYVLPWPQMGGGEVATLRVACSLRDRGVYRPIALCIASSAVARAFDAASIEVVPFTPAEFSYRRAVRYALGVLPIARSIRTIGADIVHCSDLNAVSHAAFAARLASTPVLAHVRSAFPPEEIPRHHKLPLTCVDQFVFVSHAVREHFDRIYRVSPRRGSVVYDGVPAPTPSGRTVADVRRQLGIPADAPVVGMVARIAPAKDFDTLIRAFANITAIHPTARLLLVGDDQDAAYSARLRALVRSLGQEDRVHWTGFRRDVDDLIRAIDVFVLSTHTEGFGLVLLEAMSHRKPTIATRVGGVPEIITDGQNGLLCDPGDAIGLARTLARVLEDGALAERLAAAGLSLARTRFTLERTVDDISGLYDRLMRTRSAARGAAIPPARVEA